MLSFFRARYHSLISRIREKLYQTLIWWKNHFSLTYRPSNDRTTLYFIMNRKSSDIPLRFSMESCRRFNITVYIWCNIRFHAVLRTVYRLHCADSVALSARENLFMRKCKCILGKFQVHITGTFFRAWPCMDAKKSAAGLAFCRGENTSGKFGAAEIWLRAGNSRRRNCHLLCHSPRHRISP